MVIALLATHFLQTFFLVSEKKTNEHSFQGFREKFVADGQTEGRPYFIGPCAEMAIQYDTDM